MKSLKGRIFFSVILFVLIPIIGVMAVGWKRTMEGMEEQQITVYQENAGYLSRLCDSLFEEIKNKSLLIYNDEKTMEILSEGEEISQEDQRRLNGKVSSIFYSDDDIESVTFYVEKSQLMIYKKRNAISRFYTLKDKAEAADYFTKSYDPDEAQYSISTVENEKTQKFQVVLNQNIMDKYYKPLVNMEILYDQSVFEPIFSRAGRDEFSGNFILDEKEQFIYEEFGGRFPRGMSKSIQEAPEGISHAVDGEPYVIIKTKMEKFPYEVVKCVAMEMILEHMLPYENGMALVFCLVIVIIALLAVVLSRLVSGSIRKFTQAIVNFRSQGNSMEQVMHPGLKEMEELAGEFSAMVQEINELIEEKSELRYREKKTQLQMLIVQINPHFLYNSLQTLQFIALKRKAYEINTMLISLGKILRYSLDWENGEVVLEAEIDNVLEYLNIQKFRYVDELHLEIEKPDRLPDCAVPKMILQPLVENSFVHGFQGKTEDYRIKLLITCSRNEIEIRILDNGRGMECNGIEKMNQELEHAESYKVTGHTGLLSANFRLRQIYPEASVRVGQDDWFWVEVKIPGG